METMEPIMTVVLILSIVVCGYMAWNIGANDVANAMGTSVGSRALTLKQAVIIAAIFEFLGAFFAGDAVTDTVRKGILTVDFETVTDEFANDLIIKLPNLIEGTQKYKVGSSHELLKTCNDLEDAINSISPKDKKDDYMFAIGLYKEAASISIKTNEPIFFSY